MKEPAFDVIVIGGGHAGCEAAHASARMGCRTALVTLRRERIGFMSCNPAIGGLAKGQLAKEVDAMGGLMGIVTDLTAIQYKRLNASKGPAVRGSRAQCDKLKYAAAMQERILGTPNLVVIEAEVESLAADCAVLRDGSKLSARAMIVTSGTFLSAIMHCGEVQTLGGRVGERAAMGLSHCLLDLGFRLRRLKTGTPPRLHRKSIAWARLQEQYGDIKPQPFSFYGRPDPFPYLPQVACHLTATNPRTHDVIRQNLFRSPMLTGAIQGTGPRYCPSIEDKVQRFAHRDHHPIFLEPEGLDVDEVYVNGVSTSLPADVQEEFIRTIDGCEHAEFIRHGYAVEYDAVDARQLKVTLEAKDVPGLFLAGQVNGTSGYEEAAGQGLVAGINAARYAQGKEPVVLTRQNSYLGVMIDDLTLRGSDEPYRMFTSRAEHRLTLREDNADLRLAQIAFDCGALSGDAMAMVGRKLRQIEEWEEAAADWYVRPHDEGLQWFDAKDLARPKDRQSGLELLKRPEVTWGSLLEMGFDGGGAPEAVREQIEIRTKYAGYIARDAELVSRIEKSERRRIPEELDYATVAGLSNEIRAALKTTRPETLGQFSRIQGVTPAAVANLLIHLKIRESERRERA